MVQTMIADRMMSELSCTIVMTDFNKPAANRLLFAGVTLTDTPATQRATPRSRQTIKHLHKSLWKEDLAVTDAEVQRTVRSVQGRLGRSCHRTGPPDDLRLQQHQRPELHRPLVGRRDRLHDRRREVPVRITAHRQEEKEQSNDRP